MAIYYWLKFSFSHKGSSLILAFFEDDMNSFENIKKEVKMKFEKEVGIKVEVGQDTATDLQNLKEKIKSQLESWRKEEIIFIAFDRIFIGISDIAGEELIKECSNNYWCFLFTRDLPVDSVLNELRKQNRFLQWYTKTQIVYLLSGIRTAIDKPNIQKNFWGIPLEIHVQQLSLLKHSIAHLWLPLDIDLQGIRECYNDGRKDAACKYLEDVLEDKKDKTKDQNNNPTYTSYRQKLAVLQYMITGFDFGVQGSELNDPCSEDAKPVDCSKEVKEFMNGKESVLELIEKREKVNNDLIKEWHEVKGKYKEIEKLNKKIEEIGKFEQTLLTLAGLVTNLQPTNDTNSPIFQFMCLLDCRIQNKKYDNVSEILNFFQSHKLLDEEGKEKQFSIGSIDKPIESFNDWFCALDDCLHKIRENLYK